MADETQESKGAQESQEEPEAPQEGPGQKPRVFHYDGRDMPDPDPTMTPEEVRTLMQDFFPELANADIVVHERENDTMYELVRKVGTKG